MITFTVHSLHLPSDSQFVLACSPAGFIDLSNEQSRSVLAARHPAEKQAGSGFRLSNKPLTHICHPPKSRDKSDAALREPECDK